MITDGIDRLRCINDDATYWLGLRYSLKTKSQSLMKMNVAILEEIALRGIALW